MSFKDCTKISFYDDDIIYVKTNSDEIKAKLDKFCEEFPDCYKLGHTNRKLKYYKILSTKLFKFEKPTKEITDRIKKILS